MRQLLDILEERSPREGERTEEEVDELIAEAEKGNRNHEYEKKINALISVAEKMATTAVGAGPESKEDRRAHNSKWDRAYHDAMHQLTFEAGLRRLSWQRK